MKRKRGGEKGQLSTSESDLVFFCSPKGKINSEKFEIEVFFKWRAGVLQCQKPPSPPPQKEKNHQIEI
jgi:hypothetical protein